jgi:hypothetical protein
MKLISIEDLVEFNQEEDIVDDTVVEEEQESSDDESCGFAYFYD